MMELIKKGIVLLGIYSLFTAYLFLASERFEQLDKREEEKIVNVSLNYGE